GSSPLRPLPSLVAQRVDRIHARRAAGGPEAEEDAHGGREEEGEEDRARGDRGGPAGEPPDRLGRADAEQDADDSPGQAEDERLDQELKEDVAPAGAERLPDADLARPFGDRDEHDVHDPDAADDERDERDTGEQE